MLDQETKRKIDSARQILVGKIPDPKAQVEQITTALIYKFMDDMDKESQEMGGKASFFVGDFAQYAWTKIMDSRLSGQDRMNLYVEAITKLAREVHIPLLFRNIFKDSFLPFRDERTVGLFLKEIDGFRYDHSEDLGDAYEYLLSILDSQGDAGQFRTPRHIIDFIVKVINPQKNETILDPACGTAGFLISSYKHIWAQNKEKPLTPDEKKKLMGNVTGYDISPDMVKLALVNLYLHGFSSPEIYEYDTLTDQRRWDDHFDVILTNPPFMTPKGGIRPHNRFSIQANRSEVLFVDYIAEHLSMWGRAGIIVPEGIIFQAANAYKSLRKNLLENWGLYGVVSLPNGIFQPYSGVKTSILLLDRELAKRTNDIVFVKVENDGYDLGAQRKESDKNDLPDCLRALQQWKRARVIDEGNRFAFAVSRTKIAADGAYNLTGDRYRETADYNTTKWQMVELGEVCDIFNGSTPKRSEKKYWENGTIPWFTIEDIREQGRKIKFTKQKITEFGFKNSSVKLLPKNTVLLCCTASVGEFAFAEIELTTNQQFNGLVVKKEFKEKLCPRFLFLMSSALKKELERLSGKTSFNFVSVGTIRKIKIPLPPLDVQERIVAELELYQKVIDGAKQVVASWKPSFRIDPNWNLVKIREVCEVSPSKQKVKSQLGDDKLVSFAPMNDLEIGEKFLVPKQKRRLKEVFKNYTYFRNDDILLAKITPCFENGKLSIAKNLENGVGFGSTELIILRCSNEITSDYLHYFLSQKYFRDLGKESMSGTAGQQRLSKEFVKNYQIPLPPLEVQKQIMAEIDAERQLIDGNKALIAKMQKKIEAKIGEVWGDDTSSL